MPTGYTAAVGDGTLTDFPAFAMQCAHAFGALITVRDDLLDAPVPEVFQPESWYAERVAEAKGRLARLCNLTVDQQDAECRAQHAAAVEARARRRRERAETRSRYEAMAQMVERWQPPTADHAGLKDFMRSQLLESIKFDCGGEHYDSDPDQPKRSEWYENALSAARNEVERAERALADEIDRCAKRTQWVASLKASLTASK